MPPSQVKRKEVESPRRSKSLGGRNPSTLKPCKKPAGGLNPSIINTTKRLEVLGGQNPSTTKITHQRQPIEFTVPLHRRTSTDPLSPITYSRTYNTEDLGKMGRALGVNVREDLL